MYQFFGLALIYQWTSIGVARRAGGHDPPIFGTYRHFVP